MFSPDSTDMFFDALFDLYFCKKGRNFGFGAAGRWKRCVNIERIISIQMQFLPFLFPYALCQSLVESLTRCLGNVEGNEVKWLIAIAFVTPGDGKQHWWRGFGQIRVG